MQKFTVVGIKEITYKDKIRKIEKTAKILFTTYELTEDASEGFGTESFFCVGDVLDDADLVTVGDIIVVNYNKNGFLVSVDVINS